MADAKIEQLKQEWRECGVLSPKVVMAVTNIIAYAESLTAQLSAIRDSGDAEVERLRHTIADLGPSLAGEADRLRDIAISRGQTRTDAVNKAAEWAKECEGLQEKITTLADERDRLQKELDWERKCHTDEFTERMITQEESRDTCEALRKVEAERDEARKGENTQCTIRYMVQDELDEVKKQLSHILSCIITVKQENTPEWMEYIVEEVNKVNEAMDDPDRVTLSLGGIVIVKGESPNAD